MREGDAPVTKHDRSSLRLLGTVGEPINPEAWLWYWRTVGDETLCDRRHLVADRDRRDHDHHPARRACDEAGLGRAALLRHRARTGRRRRQGAGGRRLGQSLPRPLLARPDAQRLRRSRPLRADLFLAPIPGKYFTGDGCRRDEDDYYWITGRVDDVLNVSGHRLGTAEVESALVSHPLVAEAAVVGYPHDIKGQGIYCYVTLIAGEEGADALAAELRAHVRKEIGPIATPDLIHFTPGLPKTRSGKIMRRILRKIAENEFGALGDISTLAEPQLVDDLIAGRQNL